MVSQLSGSDERPAGAYHEQTPSLRPVLAHMMANSGWVKGTPPGHWRRVAVPSARASSALSPMPSFMCSSAETPRPFGVTAGISSEGPQLSPPSRERDWRVSKGLAWSTAWKPALLP